MHRSRACSWDGPVSTVKGPVRKLSLGVAAIGLLLTTALALLAVAANASSQRRLLRLQAREAAATVSASLPAVSSQLSDALTVVIATKRPSVFDHFLVQTGTSRQVTSITLWKITPKGPHLLTGTGPTPHLVADRMAKGFFAKVPVTGALYVSPILASSPRLRPALSDRPRSRRLCGDDVTSEPPYCGAR